MKRKRYNIAVVGATGAVGTEMLRILEQRRFPVSGLQLLASRRSKGKRIVFNGSTHRVEVLTNRSFNGIDIALFSAGAARAKEFAPEAVRRGAIVVDNSSAYRMDQKVPLIVPEVNPQALRKHKGLIANPNCSTIIMLLALAPLHKVATLQRIIVSTYQSVSGAGTKAMLQLYQETKALIGKFRVSSSAFRVNSKLETRNSKLTKVLPAQIAFNLIPQIDAFMKDGSTKEEAKMVNETRKILNIASLPVSATCIRTPVFFAHSEAIWIQTKDPITVASARWILRKAPGVSVFDNPAKGRYPTPIDAAGYDDVFVGRIRKDPAFRNGLALWVCGDNLRKGAATNAVQIAELLIKGNKS